MLRDQCCPPFASDECDFTAMPFSPIRSLIEQAQTTCYTRLHEEAGTTESLKARLPKKI